MITANAPLLQSILDQPQPSLAVRCAQRLERFVRTEFNPKSDASWSTAGKLWRAALLTHDVERAQP